MMSGSNGERMCTNSGSGIAATSSVSGCAMLLLADPDEDRHSALVRTLASISDGTCDLEAHPG